VCFYSLAVLDVVFGSFLGIFCVIVCIQCMCAFVVLDLVSSVEPTMPRDWPGRTFPK